MHETVEDDLKNFMDKNENDLELEFSISPKLVSLSLQLVKANEAIKSINRIEIVCNFFIFRRFKLLIFKVKDLKIKIGKSLTYF